MLSFEEQLFNLREEEIFGKDEKKVEVEGSKVLEHCGFLSKLLNDLSEAINNKEKMLEEDIQLIDKTQLECIEKLGDILDKIDEM